MYTTCLFCNKTLGSNEIFETFPVGKRLAFDPARGRLWVVCPHCERWNLSPLDERWEAIDRAERLYRETRTRVATDNIGLGRLRDGTTIVRIGEPLRPEFAAWRYGDQFGRRRRNRMLIAGGGVVLLGGLVIGGATVGVGIGSMGWLLSRAAGSIIRGNPEAVVARIATQSNGVVPVRRRHLAETTIDRTESGEMAINLRFKNGKARFEGREAERIAAIVIPTVNRFGGTKDSINQAVAAIDRGGGSEGYLDELSQRGQGLTQPASSDEFSFAGWGGFQRGRTRRQAMGKGLFAIPSAQALALEMALHEEAERRAMEGELAELERAWQSAEEIAGIADSLLVPPEIDAAAKKLKDGQSD